MKRFLIKAGIVLGIFMLLLGIGFAWLLYEFDYKRTEIAQSRSGNYTLTMFQVGEPGFPFGPVSGEFVLRKDGKKINTYSFLVFNDGGSLSPGNAVFEWEEDCVRIMVRGEEQEDKFYTLGFDGSRPSETFWREDEQKSGGETSGEEHTQRVDEGSVGEEITQEGTVQEGNIQDCVESDKEENVQGISQETMDYYMSMEPTCSFCTNDGVEYRMVAVDRALGSDFYVLIGVEEQGRSCTFVNQDPYNGSGGRSEWITFIDKKVGFSCLSHAAGTCGSLYRTGDGGVSWEMIEYPSARAMLSDGTEYNPFVMPEKVYEEDGILYLEVGQGADGDYYDEKAGFCHGRYQSTDQGMNWEFVGNIPVGGEINQ